MNNAKEAGDTVASMRVTLDEVLDSLTNMAERQVEPRKDVGTFFIQCLLLKPT